MKLLVAHVPRNSRKLIKKRAKDSMSMVTMALYNSPAPAATPIALRMFLLCRTSRVTIMVVRRRLSEEETAKYGAPKWTIALTFRRIESTGRPIS